MSKGKNLNKKVPIETEDEASAVEDELMIDKQTLKIIAERIIKYKEDLIQLQEEKSGDSYELNQVKALYKEVLQKEKMKYKEIEKKLTRAITDLETYKSKKKISNHPHVFKEMTREEEDSLRKTLSKGIMAERNANINKLRFEIMGLLDK